MSLDPMIASNLQLIVKLQLQILDDDVDIARMPNRASDNKAKPSLEPSISCTCSTRIIDGKKWSVVNLECFDHGLFPNRPDPYQARDYSLSKHQYAE